MTKISIEQIAAFAKRKGFIFPSSEIYGGMSGFFDYGPLGMELARNIKNLWWKSVVLDREIVEGIDGSIVSSNKVWEASGHVENFVDLLVSCKKCKTKLRADHLIEEKLKMPADGMDKKQLSDLIKKHKIKCNCNGELEKVTAFNLMFETNIGASGKDKAFLRPETAQLIFTNFKNVLETTRQKLPFGIAQIGKAFRNEISPRNFLFRMREFEQMEMEFFVHPDGKDRCSEFDIVKKVKVNVLTAKEQATKKPKTASSTIGDLLKKKIFKTKWHAFWVGYRYQWFLNLGIKPKNLRIREHLKDELSHYSNATWDIEYNYPFGWKELEGIADRTDFDLKQHSKFSGKDLVYFDTQSKEKIIPHVAAEPSLGVERALLTFLLDAYHEETVKGEKRILLKFKPALSPYKLAVFPLVKRDGLNEEAKKIFKSLRDKFHTFYDEGGSIGRRYRRMDEIGTPFCITIDYDTLKDKTVTVRDRDTMKQVRVKIKDLEKQLKKRLK